MVLQKIVCTTLLGVFFLGFKTLSYSQNYSVVSDSVGFTPISGSSLVMNSSDQAIVHPGFTLSLCNKSSDSVVVSKNGLLIVSGYCFSVFTSRQSLSPVTYQVSGSPGTRKLTFQYNNVSLSGYGCPDSITYQVSIKEGTGEITYHQGPYTAIGCDVSDTTYNYQPIIGLFSMRSAPGGGMLEGPEENPVFIPFSVNGVLEYLDRIPSVGRRYVFTPSNL